VPHFSGDHRLGTGRQRRVPHGERLVVREVASLLVVGEGVASQMHGEHEVGLVDHLLAIEVEVREVEQERVLVGRGGAEVPDLVTGEGLRLGVDAERIVVGDAHRSRRVPPRSHLLVVDAKPTSPVGISLGDVCRRGEMCWP